MQNLGVGYMYINFSKCCHFTSLVYFSSEVLEHSPYLPKHQCSEFSMLATSTETCVNFAILFDNKVF